ncbi:MAG: 2'-5' RNA ligase family protein, partial [Sciscionella sp.]
LRPARRGGAGNAFGRLRCRRIGSVGFVSAPGTSSGRIQSAVLIPVPRADAVVGRWRREHDPVAAAGVPAHVTLIVPWLPPGEIRPDDLESLDGELSDVKSFEFDLLRVDWFGRRVLWVAPEPAEPFVELTNRLSERFTTPPWEGEFDKVVPHLTVAHSGEGVDLDPVAQNVAAQLPLRCRAEEIWVMCAGGTRWELRHRVRLAP